MSSALDRLSKRAEGNAISSERILDIPLEKIRFDPTQPRQAFHPIDGRVSESDQAAVVELAESIDARGLIEPIVVQELADDGYLVVVGERRTRAHLYLKKKTIRAVVRNDLTKPSERLLYQLAENVNREDLTDAELSASILKLQKGGDGAEPMTQVQIARQLGKSEGWVSRFVKFGDAEVQRLWVKSGIADTVEKAYRLTLLPKAMQADVIARTELPKKDPNRLVKPLNRDIIDELTRESKRGTARKQQAPSQENGAPDLQSKSAQSVSGFGGQGDAHSEDGVAGLLASAVIGSHAPAVVADSTDSNGAPRGTKYRLPEEDRTKMLGMPFGSSGSSNDDGQAETVLPPVNCRVSVNNVIALLKTLADRQDIGGAILDVRCDLNIPGALAQQVANTLSGNIVDKRDVQAVIQATVSGLQ